MKNIEAIPALAAKEVDAVSQTAKLATLLALSTFPEGDHATMLALGKRVTELQGPEPVLTFTAERVVTYCATSFVKAGFIELSSGQGQRKRKRQVQTTHMTPKGRTGAMAVAGALLPLEFDAPEEAFLRKVVGTRQDFKISPFLTLYQHLREGPRRIAELKQRTGIGYSTLSSNVRSLCDLGVLASKQRDDPANRRYIVADKPYKLRSDTKPIVRVAIEAAVALRDERRGEVSGAEILDRAHMLLPAAPKEEINRLFLRWVRCNKKSCGLIIPVDDGSKGPYQKNDVRITDLYRPYIEKLLEARRLLTDHSSEGADFRVLSQRRAEEIVDSPKQMTMLLAPEAQSPLQALSQAEWCRKAEELVSETDIVSIKDLYSITTKALKRHVSYAHFRQCLTGSEVLEIIIRPTGPKGRNQTHVRHKPKQVFPTNWANKAACRSEDPELFFPPSLSGPSIKQADHAKTICQDCPVRLPCLKNAFNNKVTHGVHGGIWLENPGELTHDLINEVAKTVRIG